MPKGKKLCHSCNKEHGARKLKCECGHVFGAGKPPKQGKKADGVKGTRHPLGQTYVPEPGLWVFDRGNFPPVHCPADIPPGPMNNQEVYEYIVYNGLGDCIFEEIQSRKIADPSLRKKWIKARAAMAEVWSYLIDDTESHPTTDTGKTSQANPEGDS